MSNDEILDTLEDVSSYLSAKAVHGNPTWSAWAEAVNAARHNMDGLILSQETFGEFVREKRLEQGLSQVCVGAISGYGHCNVSHLERNDYKIGPNLDACIRVLDALGYEFRVVKKA